MTGVLLQSSEGVWKLNIDFSSWTQLFFIIVFGVEIESQMELHLKWLSSEI